MWLHKGPLSTVYCNKESKQDGQLSGTVLVQYQLVSDIVLFTREMSTVLYCTSTLAVQMDVDIIVLTLYGKYNKYQSIEKVLSHRITVL